MLTRIERIFKPCECAEPIPPRFVEPEPIPDDMIALVGPGDEVPSDKPYLRVKDGTGIHYNPAAIRYGTAPVSWLRLGETRESAEPGSPSPW